MAPTTGRRDVPARLSYPEAISLQHADALHARRGLRNIRQRWRGDGPLADPETERRRAIRLDYGSPRKGPPSLADTGLEAAAAANKPVRAIGQFRGGNLCRDLPETTRRDSADWVLMTTEGAVWVTGRRPEGKGFRLDPADRADTSRWLEVNGRVEVAGEARYLKASRVALIARPGESEPAACPR